MCWRDRLLSIKLINSFCRKNFIRDPTPSSKPLSKQRGRDILNAEKYRQPDRLIERRLLAMRGRMHVWFSFLFHTYLKTSDHDEPKRQSPKPHFYEQRLVAQHPYSKSSWASAIHD